MVISVTEVCAKISTTQSIKTDFFVSIYKKESVVTVGSLLNQ